MAISCSESGSRISNLVHQRVLKVNINHLIKGGRRSDMALLYCDTDMNRCNGVLVLKVGPGDPQWSLRGFQGVHQKKLKLGCSLL